MENGKRYVNDENALTVTPAPTSLDGAVIHAWHGPRPSPGRQFAGKSSIFTKALYPLTLLGLLLLAACGFTPLYGTSSLSGNANAVRGNIAIDKIGGREGQILTTALEDRFNPEGFSTRTAPYHLSIGLVKTVTPSVVKSDSTIQRYEVRIDTSFKLFKAGEMQPVFTGGMRRTGSYNAAVNANFATYEAGEDMIGRILQELAEDYLLRISSYLAAGPIPPVTGPAAVPPAAIASPPHP